MKYLKFHWFLGCFFLFWIYAFYLCMLYEFNSKTPTSMRPSQPRVTPIITPCIERKVFTGGLLYLQRRRFSQSFFQNASKTRPLEGGSWGLLGLGELEPLQSPENLCPTYKIEDKVMMFLVSLLLAPPRRPRPSRKSF